MMVSRFLAYMWRLCYCMVLLFLSPAAPAFDASGYLQAGAQGSLTLRFVRPEWSVNQTPRSLRLNQVVVTGYEPPYPWLQGGLHIGAMELIYDPVMASPNDAQTGYLAGLQLRSMSTQGPLALRAELIYSFNHTDNQTAQQQVTTNWHELTLATTVTTRVKALELSLGAYYLELSGIERTTGSLDQLSDITTDHHFGTQLMLGLWLDHDAKIILSATQQAYRSWALDFVHYY